MRKIVAVGTVLLMVLVSLSVQAQPQEKEPSVWMRLKLKNSQEILAGLAAADFEQIRQSAVAMRGLNQIESFVRRRDEGYRTQLQVFQYSLDELVRDAEAKDLDAATLAFTQMTLSCVNCHRELRKS
jgi:hypothetical protein